MDYHVKGKSVVIDWLLHRSPTLPRRLDTLLLLISGKQSVGPQLTRPLESKIASKLGRWLVMVARKTFLTSGHHRNVISIKGSGTCFIWWG